MGAAVRPGTIQKLVRFADAEDQEKAQEAIHKAAWQQERVGGTVEIAMPPPGQDFNDGLRVRSFQERAWDLDRFFLNLTAFNGDLILDEAKLNMTSRLKAVIQGEVRAYYAVYQFQRVAASVVAETG